MPASINTNGIPTTIRPSIPASSPHSVGAHVNHQASRYDTPPGGSLSVELPALQQPLRERAA